MSFSSAVEDWDREARGRSSRRAKTARHRAKTLMLTSSKKEGLVTSPSFVVRRSGRSVKGTIERRDQRKINGRWSARQDYRRPRRPALPTAEGLPSVVGSNLRRSAPASLRAA